MDEKRLAAALEGMLGITLSKELVSDLIKMRRDLATKTLERAVPGKFVETFVQCLQHMAVGKYDIKPNVDDYLDKKAENTSLPEGIRICAARVARSIYTFRNKRNIAHKNDVDVNVHDLAFVHSGAAWITAELLRNARDISMQEAGTLIDLIQTPIGTLVEEIGDVRLVHADVSARTEILILMHSHYPDAVPVANLVASLSRRSSQTVKNRLREMHGEKVLHGDAKSGYRLTTAGHAAAVKEIKALSP